MIAAFRLKLVLCFTVIFSLQCLYCLKFIKVPNKVNVVLGQNSTNVKLTWTFDLEGVALNQIKIKRYRKDEPVKTLTNLGVVYSSNTAAVLSPKYGLNASGLSSPAYASLTIKDVLNQSSNVDGTEVDVLKNTYGYNIEVDVQSISVPGIINNVELQVLVKPESTSITIRSKKSVFCNGSQIQINCTSRANPPAVYSLYRNNTLVQSGSTSGYFIVTLNKVGNYRYTCVPSNEAGVGQNKSLYLMVKEPPNIKSCESDKTTTVVEGKRFTFPCNISGSEPLTITWTDGTRVWNTKSLTFDPVNRTNNGTYNLTVSNGEECPKAERKNMTLNVYFIPESTSIIIMPNKRAFCNGSQVQINCTSHANPPAVYSLYRNNTLLQSGSSSGYFNVTLNKVGNFRYTCVPSNAAGVGQNKSSYLMVKEPPNITNCKSGTAINATEGGKFTFPCKISGSEPLNITWTDGTRVWNTKSLTFDPVNRGDAGTYSLTVGNGEECPEAERKNMTVDVYFIPESTSIIIMPNNRAFCNGSQIKINCTSHANPPAVYSLYRNNTLVQSGSTSGYFNVTLNKVGSYRYTCVPSNAAGVGQNKSSYLMVKGD